MTLKLCYTELTREPNANEQQDSYDGFSRGYMGAIYTWIGLCRGYIGYRGIIQGLYRGYQGMGRDIMTQIECRVL